MKIYELIKKCTFEQVAEKLVLHYDIKNLDEYRKLYSRLEKTVPNTVSDFYIYISAFKSGDLEDVYITDFDENDTSLYFDVCGYYKGSELEIYSVASSSFSEFTAFNVDDDTLSGYSYASIIAHCLYEITYYGFDDTDR